MMFVALKKMPYAQAKVQILETGENFRCNLVSYTTCVAHIIKDGWLIVNGLYSATTRRHLSAFASEYRTNYYKLKKCYEQKLTYNIYTGKFVSLVTGEIVEG